MTLLRKIKDFEYEVYYNNGMLLGSIYQEIDGYFVFLPILRQGYWDGPVLEQIAKYLEDLNKEWDKEIQETLKEYEEEKERSGERREKT